MLIAGGESRNVPGVMDALDKELTKMIAIGLDVTLFENVKRACYGTQLKTLGSFSAIAQALADGAFADYQPLGALDEISRIGIGDVHRFIAENITPEKLALSVVSPLDR